MQLFGTNAINRTHGATEYVVGSFILASSFERHNIKRLFDDGN